MRRFIVTFAEGTEIQEVQVDAETSREAQAKAWRVARETMADPRLTGIRFGSRVIPATRGAL